MFKTETTMTTPRTDAVVAEQYNFGAYPGSDGMDGVTAQEAHDTCFASLERLSRELESTLTTQSAELIRLREALKKYGTHLYGCHADWADVKCNCGLAAALSRG